MDRNEVLKGQELLARKLWPAISDKTRILLSSPKSKGMIIPVMDTSGRLYFNPYTDQFQTLFRQIIINIEAHTGGFMGYNAEIDTLVIRPLVTG